MRNLDLSVLRLHLALSVLAGDYLLIYYQQCHPNGCFGIVPCTLCSGFNSYTDHFKVRWFFI